MTVAYLASDVDGHGVGELEGVEEGVGDDGGSAVSRSHLHELGEHFGTEDAPVLVRQLDGADSPSVAGFAGLDPHVELS